MQFFEILCIILGVANGALLQLLPDPNAAKKPIGAIVGFSLAFALFTGFLPVIVSSPRFLTTLSIALIGALCGFYAVASAKAPKENTQTTRPAQLTHTA
jgi:hypothetical protein